MKQPLPIIIRQDDSLRQILLSQEGGIMKYWAEHPEAEFDVDLFEGYEKQITEEYLHANKQSRAVRSLPADKLREKSLDWYRMSKGSELKFFVAMKPALNAIDKEVSSQVLNHIDIYMTDAYKESRRRKWPTGIPPLDFYNETLKVYGLGGLSLDCLEHVLQEYRGKTVNLTFKHFVMANIFHHGESSEWKEVDELQTEFDIRMFLDAYIVDGGFKKLRQAVKEMIDNSTRGLSDEKCTAMCVELAKDDMGKVNQFTRWVYNKTYPMEETSDGKFVPLITPEERHWLKNIMYDNSPGATGRQKLTLMRKYYSCFISILEDIGRIWAAQLLVHGTDMKQLEEEEGIILSKLPNTMYYVDGRPGDRRCDCCVIDMREAKELLKKLSHLSQDDETPDEHQKLPLSEEKIDKEKAQRLLATNVVIKLSEDEEQQKMELLRLYKFIKKHFVVNIRHKYEWYALKRFLDKYNLLKECDNEQFACQMNNKEWFGNLEAKLQCSANEMNTYNYLKADKSSNTWIEKEIPGGSRASKRAVERIYLKYEDLVLYDKEIMNA